MSSENHHALLEIKGAVARPFYLLYLAIMIPSTSALDHELIRRLQDDGTHSKRVLTILYLCVLCLCFIVPLFYYFRMHCEERHARRMRELEMAGMREALEQSEQNREESRAVRRKYREERRARIIQLFDPVRIILKEEHFPHLREKSTQLQLPTGTAMGEPEDAKESCEEYSGSDVEEGREPQKINKSELVDITKPSVGVGNLNDGGGVKPTKGKIAVEDTTDEDEPAPEEIPSNLPHKFVDEETTLILIPKPGLNITPNVDEDSTSLRLVESLCSICLCNYEVGSDIVWSSNSACEHVFHEICIEQWLMKQREGPLCPCCRRDFIIDPYDLEEEEAEETPIISLGMLTNFNQGGDTSQVVSLAEFQVGATSDNDGSTGGMASSDGNNTSRDGESENPTMEDANEVSESNDENNGGIDDAV